MNVFAKLLGGGTAGLSTGEFFGIMSIRTNLTPLSSATIVQHEFSKVQLATGQDYGSRTGAGRVKNATVRRNGKGLPLGTFHRAKREGESHF
jgi:hypothetical protein